MRAKDLRKMSDDELNRQLKELRLELAKERANINVGATVTSPGKIREIRKNIARILTIKREKRVEHE